MTTRIFYSAAGVPQATNSVQLDRRGNVIRRVDAAGNVFTATFDGLDRSKVTSGPSVVSVNTSREPIAYTTNVLSHTFMTSYDAAGRFVTSVNGLGETTVTAKDALGRTTSTIVYSSSGALVRETYYAYSDDHNSVTITDGSGANAISHTTWTDNDGHTVLSVGYPASNILDFTSATFDLAGNLSHSERDSSSGGSVVQLTAGDSVSDGLHRVTRKTDRDGALTTYAFDALGDLTNRTMPGGLQWQAAFNNAGQLLQEQNVGGGNTTRITSYTYFPSNSPFAGLLQTRTDGRGVVCTYQYDDWLHVTNATYTGPLPEENMMTSWHFDPRGFVTGIFEQFADRNTGPPTSVRRTFDAYGQVTTESVNGGVVSYGASQSFDVAGRRTTLGIANEAYGFAWRADGVLAAAAVGSTGEGDYDYETSGLLTSRAVGVRATTTTARDGEGHPASIVTTVNGNSQLTEAMSWTPDGLLATHLLQRSDFTDSHSFGYATLTRRLVQEQLNLNGTTTWTNIFGYDAGAAAGPGVLTSAGAGTTLWSGQADSFSRLSLATNNSISYAAFGHVNGQATMNAWLDNQPVSVTSVGTNAMVWRADMELSPGPHQLRVAAAHPSGQFTALATNSFTSSIPYQSTTDTFDGGGNVTQRVWLEADGTPHRTQTLSWDARGRLHAVSDRDASGSGFNWTAAFDGLGRRLSTTSLLVTNGIAFGSSPTVINSYFDPQVEFLELGVAYGTNTEWKLYGPDLTGQYGDLNGTGGFDAVSRGRNGFAPLVSDFRGNILGAVANSAVSWNPARPTGFGAVPGYRPLALGGSTSIGLASAWRGRWPDITGYYQIGARTYDPVNGQWQGFDPVWNGRDPNAYTFCGGDPINRFDADGRCVKNVGNWAVDKYNGFAATAQGFANPATARQTGLDFAYGEASGSFNWFIQNAQGINNLLSYDPLYRQAGDVVNQALNNASNYGNKYIDTVGFGFGANENSPAANFGRDYAQGALTIASMFVGVGEASRAGEVAGALPKLEQSLVSAAERGEESFVFRGDRSSVTPQQIFENGFVSKGDNMDLISHVTQPLPDSGFVATSGSQEIANGFAGKNGYTFTIRDNGTGLNVNPTLGSASPFPEQMEVAFPGSIRSADIVGATSKRTGEYIPNPNYNESP